MTAGWLPLMAWGAVLLAGSVASQVMNNSSFWYWAIAIPLAIAVSAVAGRRASQDLRIDTAHWPYRIVGATMFVVGFGIWYVVDQSLAALIWWLVIAGGMAVMSLLDKQHILALALGAITIWGVGFWAIEPGSRVLITLIAALGAAMLAAGATLRMIRTQS